MNCKYLCSDKGEMLVIKGIRTNTKIKGKSHQEMTPSQSIQWKKTGHAVYSCSAKYISGVDYRFKWSHYWHTHTHTHKHKHKHTSRYLNRDIIFTALQLTADGTSLCKKCSELTKDKLGQQIAMLGKPIKNYPVWGSFISNGKTTQVDTYSHRPYICCQIMDLAAYKLSRLEVVVCKPSR